MEPAVNLDNLRGITGGDGEMEAELFKLFFDSFAQCKEKIYEAFQAKDDDAWRAQAHALKGICFNLGAQPLGELCSRMQDGCHASPNEKQKMLDNMEKEMARVTAMLNAGHTG